MKCFDWQLEYSRSFGKVKRPLAEVYIKTVRNEWQPLFAYVDSGADVTVIKRSFADLIGIKVEDGKFAEFSGIGGGRIEAYIHRVDLKIGYYMFKEVEVAFCTDDTPPNLLGRKGIFEVMDVYFKCIDEATCFLRKK